MFKPLQEISTCSSLWSWVSNWTLVRIKMEEFAQQEGNWVQNCVKLSNKSRQHPGSVKEADK